MASALLAGGSALRAGQTPGQAPVFRTGVDLVQVDVSVLDRKRQPVRGLTAEDFTVMEDGKPVAIEAFAAVDLPPRPPVPAGTAAWVREVAPDVAANDLPREGRFVVIMFDQTLRPIQLPVARRAAMTTVDTMGPNDLAAVIHVLGSGALADQGFTRDRARLARAIDSATFGPASADQALAAAGGQALQDPMSQSAPYSRGDRGQCPYGLCTFETITRVADALRDVPRRKTLMFIGTSLTVETFGESPEQERAREVMFRALDVANLTVNVLDPTGLETLAADASPPSGVRPSKDRTPIMEKNLIRQGNLSVLPARTGGRAVMNANDPDAFVRDILDETSAYYTLAFRPRATKADGVLHQIRVTVNREDVTVNARKAFYAGSGPRPAVTLDDGIKKVPAALMDALVGNWPTPDLPLNVSIAPFADPSGSRPAVVLSIASERASDRESTGPIDVLVEAFDRDGRSVNFHHQALDIGEALAASGSGRYEILSRLPLDPGRYEIRAGIHDAATKRVGTVHTYVDVPDFARTPLTMSGVLIQVTPAPLTAPRALLAGLVDAAPTARRTFAATDVVKASLRVFQGGSPQNVTVTTQIQDGGGRMVVDEKASVKAEEFKGRPAALDVSRQLSLTELPPGSYLLSVIASHGRTTVRRDVRFAIE